MFQRESLWKSVRSATSTFLSVTRGSHPCREADKQKLIEWIKSDEYDFVPQIYVHLCKRENYCVIFWKIWPKNAVSFDLFCHFHSLNVDTGKEVSQRPAVVSKSWLFPFYYFLILRFQGWKVWSQQAEKESGRSILRIHERHKCLIRTRQCVLTYLLLSKKKLFHLNYLLPSCRRHRREKTSHTKINIVSRIWESFTSNQY